MALTARVTSLVRLQLWQRWSPAAKRSISCTMPICSAAGTKFNPPSPSGRPAASSCSRHSQWLTLRVLALMRWADRPVFRRSTVLEGVYDDLVRQSSSGAAAREVSRCGPRFIDGKAISRPLARALSSAPCSGAQHGFLTGCRHGRRQPPPASPSEVAETMPARVSMPRPRTAARSLPATTPISRSLQFFSRTPNLLPAVRPSTSACYRAMTCASRSPTPTITSLAGIDAGNLSC